MKIERKKIRIFLAGKFKLTLSVCVAPFFLAGSNLLSIKSSLLLFSRRREGEVTSVLQSNWRCRLAIWRSFSMFCNHWKKIAVYEWVNHKISKKSFLLVVLHVPVVFWGRWVHPLTFYFCHSFCPENISKNIRLFLTVT